MKKKVVEQDEPSIPDYYSNLLVCTPIRRIGTCSVIEEADSVLRT